MGHQLAHKMKLVPLLMESATEEEFDSEDDVLVHHKCHKTIKSGKVHTADSMVVKRIIRPHKFMYPAHGQPTMYEQLSLPLFVTGYFAVVDTVKLGLKEVMFKHL